MAFSSFMRTAAHVQGSHGDPSTVGGDRQFTKFSSIILITVFGHSFLLRAAKYNKNTEKHQETVYYD